MYNEIGNLINSRPVGKPWQKATKLKHCLGLATSAASEIRYR